MSDFTVGIVVFPGSNCDRDMLWALEGCLGIKTKFIWHESSDISGFDSIVLPGGFSYGDYLRCGAVARFSPLINALDDFVKTGRRVIGICNGFQILTETGLLKGTLLRNKNLKFINKDVHIKVINNNSRFTKKYQTDQLLKINIAHNEGNYFTDEGHLEELKKENLIAFKYCNEKGNIDENSNPNGSLNNIAGIFNSEKNILGMMPHPERMVDEIISNKDGENLFSSLLS